MGYPGLPTIVLLLTYVSAMQVFAQRPTTFGRGERYPDKPETEVCGNIRDIISRDSGRYRKILVRNINSEVVFNNEDCRRMTSRTKSKLDVLATKVRSKWNGVKLRVILAWTDQTLEGLSKSLHYEGRAVRIQTSDGDRGKLGELAGLAAESGFDWVHFANPSYVHASVIRDVCQTAVDLAFILDESGSVGRLNFDKVKNFVRNVVDFFNIGKQGTRVAVITYSSSTYIEFNLDRYYTKSAVKSAVSRIYYNGGSTRTAAALNLARTTVFTRARPASQGIPKVAVLLTDGYSNGGSVGEPARRLRAAGVNVFSVGVGGSYSTAELNQIASDPDSTHVFYVNSFRDISGWVDKISSVSCDEGAVVSSCDNTVTSVDSGSFRYFRTKFPVVNDRISIEVEDEEGISHLYASTTSQNPGPLDDDSKKNESNSSPRSISLATDANKLIYVAVQGQRNINRFKLSMWNALFTTEHFTWKVEENKAPGQSFSVRSPYHNKYSLEYSIVPGRDRVPFVIDRHSGQIRTTERLDRETKASYRLTVLALDRNNRCHKGRTFVTVNVEDQNDNSPKFRPKTYTVRIKENNPPQALVAAVTATDADSGNNGRLSYSFTAGNDDSHFTIDNQGRVYATLSLDFESKSSYRLTIEAKDGGNPRKKDTATLNVIVVDVYEPPVIDDTCPTLEPKEFNLTLTENAAFKTFVTQVRGRYQLKNDTITYAIQDGNDNGAFVIDGKTGVISVSSGGVDRETSGNFRLLVRAGPESCGFNQSCSGSGIEGQGCKDENLPALGVVNIRILDENDNPPKFTKAPYDWRNVDTTKTRLPAIQAKDDDLNDGGKVKYRLGGMRQEGNVRYLTVVAYDQGKPSLESNTTIKVTPRDPCEAMTFTVSEEGEVNASTLCVFEKFSTKPKTLLLGQSLRMECSAKGNKKPQYRWMLNGRFLTDWSDNGQYSVNSVAQSDEGAYACLASSAGGIIQSGVAQVTVYERPRITEQPEDATAQGGGAGTAVLTCAGTGDPAVTYQWYKNNNKLLADENVVDPTNATLTVRAIEKKYHEAVYHCEVRNKIGAVNSREASVTVYDAEAEVKLKIDVNKPDVKRKCQKFDLEEFTKTLSAILKAKAFTTQIKVDSSLLCGVDPCESNPCMNNGKCEQQINGGFTCLCGPGWTGDECQVDLDECRGDPCFNGGTCTNLQGDYSCACPANKTGKNCELTADSCQPSSCGGQVCAPSEMAASGFQCIKKEHVIVMANIEVANGKSKFQLEKEIEDLIRSSNVQPAPGVTSRRKRNAQRRIDYGACSVRIVEVTGNTVSFVLLCPAEIQLNAANANSFVCKLLFGSGMTSSCGDVNGLNTPLPPTTTKPMKPLEIEVLIFARGKDGQDINAEVVVKELNDQTVQKELKDKMNVNVKEATATRKPPKEASTGLSTGAVVGIVVGIVVILALLLAIALTHRRQTRLRSHAWLSQRAVMNRRGSSEGIVEHNGSDKQYMNQAYNDANQENFMVQVNLGAKKKKNKS